MTKYIVGEKHLIGVVLFCMTLGLLHGQATIAPRVRFEHYSVEQGLSDRQVNAITKDHQGFLWIGTDNGLNRFDGYAFLQYDSRPRSKRKIRYNKVHTLFTDNLGNLVVMYNETDFDEIDRLHPMTGTTSRLLVEPDSSLRGRIKTAFQTVDGSIFVGVYLGPGRIGLYKYREQADTFEKVFESNHPGVDGACFFTCSRTKDGSYWFAYSWPNKPLLLVHTDAHGAVKRICGPEALGLPPGAYPGEIQLTESASGEVYFSLKNFGVFVLDDRNNGVFPKHALLPDGGYFLRRDKQGHLLAYRQQPQSPGKDVFLLHADGTAVAFPWLFERQLILLCPYSDDFSQGFMTGTGNGFMHHYLRPAMFQTMLARELGSDPYGISVRGMAKMGKNTLYIATERDGVYEMSLPEQTLRRTSDLHPELKDHNLLDLTKTMLVEGDSVLWTTRKGGVVRYHPAKQTTRFYRTRPPSAYMGSEEVWGIAPAGNGKFWIAPREGNLLLLDPVSGTLTPYLNRNGSPPYHQPGLNYMMRSRDGMLWVGTTAEGLLRIDPAKGESKRFSADPQDPSGFNSNNVTCMYEDNAGLLWVGTMESGLHVFDPGKERVVAMYTQENGLCDNSIVGILPDEKGNYWISTYVGLSYFDTELKTFRNFSVTDGLSHNEFNRFAYFYDADYKRFYFGGMNGVNVFSADYHQNKVSDAPLLVSEVSYIGQNDSTVVLYDGIVNGTEITLAPGGRLLRIKLALGNYQNPAGNQYAYRFEGMDKDWTYLGANHELRIDRLPSGTYKLHLRGADDRGNWSSRDVVLTIVVQEFWYRTWWAYLLYVVVVAAGGYLFYRFQLNKRIAEKEAQRLQQLDAFKSRFFANISHEFRTPLTVILGMTGLLKNRSGNEAELEKAADLIGRNSRQLLHLVNQLLDLSKLESWKLQLAPANGDLAAFLNYQLESFHSLAQSRGITLQFTTDEPHLAMAFDHDKMQAILANLLSNAIKFTPEGGKVSVNLRTRKFLSEGIEFEVADTGIGIPADKLDRIFDRFYQVDSSNTRTGEGTGIGLALIQELVKLMQGDIRATSTPGVGSTFLVTLPFIPHGDHLPRQLPLPEGEAVHGFEPAVMEESVADDSDPRPLLLIVEDNPDVRFYLAECVRGDYRVVTATNGAEGIAKALELVPDIVVSDVMMPEKDGFELCETLKNEEATSHIPIVLLTARADHESRIVGLRRGADDYLAKPFEPVELMARLENLVRIRRLLQQRYAAMLPAPEPNGDPGIQMEDAFLQKFREVVEAHLSDTDFDMPQLERSLGMSRSQVFRKVKALTGGSPSVLIRTIRLHKSKELLKDPSRTIAEVAYEVGFSTPAYFSTMFLEAFGQTPSEFRAF